MSPLPEKIAKYQVTCKLGSGGFAAVYRAEDPSLGRDIAIKVLHMNWADDPGVVERFYQEARSAAALRHPNIVTIYEIDQLPNGQPYIAEEYLPGLSLAAYIQQRGRLEPDQIVEILTQVGDALDYAHRFGIVHRDVKPGNIMVEEQTGGELRCVLTDFGLAKVLAGGVGQTSEPLGTAEYMAPEQISPKRFGRISAASDLYALGVLAYTLFTGAEPFVGETADVLVSHLQNEPVDPSSVCPALSVETSAVLIKSVSKEQRDRYSSAADMVAALRLALSAGKALVLTEADLSLAENATENLPAWHPQMVFIPAGASLIGSSADDPEANANEGPQHRVHLPKYAISKFPVTNAQYRIFVQQAGYECPTHWQEDGVPDGRDDHPVIQVSYQDALEYCAWLSNKSGLSFRLPSEEEWERAARGGAPETRRYPWGDHWLKGYCNTAAEGIDETTPVGQYEAYNCSPYGMVDAVGNVWEWTNSLYRRYPGSGHLTSAFGQAYVVRGGSWRNGPEDARISSRGRYGAGVKRPYLGFRIVQELA